MQYDGDRTKEGIIEYIEKNRDKTTSQDKTTLEDKTGSQDASKDEL